MRLASAASLALWAISSFLFSIALPSRIGPDTPAVGVKKSVRRRSKGMLK
jgi:hypothetical protein